MTFDIRSIDLRALNSATKYPSIPTYHTLDPKNGGLLDETVPFQGEVYLTEKIDGTNSRIVCLPDGSYVIGSREELLYARGDLIGNPALGIVDALRGLAEGLVLEPGDMPGAAYENTMLVVHFLEVYGGKVTGASKQYTGHQVVGFRLFDVAKVPGDVLDWPRERISGWRDGGGQQWLNEHALVGYARAVTREGTALDLTPRLGTLSAADLPSGVEETRKFLGEYAATTRAALDPDGGHRAEGIVLRAVDRSAIAKARFQDYDRTLKRRQGGGGR